VLAGTLHSSASEVRVFDLNIALYRRLLCANLSGGIEDYIVKRLLDSGFLSDAEGYLRVSQQAQKIFDQRCDPDGAGRLFWDTCSGLPSVSASEAWQSIMAHPQKLSFFKHLDKEISAIIEWQPDLLGFSVISDTQLPAALALAAYFRQRLPGARIIMGGPAITYRRSLLPSQHWLASVIDSFCAGEGEPMLAGLPGNHSFSACANSISWGPDKKVHFGSSRLHDMSCSIKPDFSVLPLDDYLTPHLVMPVETARGCPWGRCAFCIHPVRAATGRPLYRCKPLAIVAREIKALFARGCRHFFIVDEAIPPPRLRELANLFAALPQPVSWIGYMRLDAGHTKETFHKARAAGCRKLFIGVETGSDRILSRFNKGVDAARARRVLLDVAAADLAAHFFLMTGFPEENESDRQATLDLLADVLPAFKPFGLSFDLFPLSGELETDLMANPRAYGWNGPQLHAGNDLKWQFPILSGAARAKDLAEFRGLISNLADQILGSEFGLRHASLAQDSLHLLLLEARE
jgi:hypothetical protein